MNAENGKINLYFVIKSDCENEENVSSDMKEAFSNAVNWNLKPKWIKECECVILDNNMKGNVFVFEDFTGDVFSKFIISHQYARVIGPKCLLTCFTEQVAIPNTKSPVFNMAMNGLSITASIKSPETKKKIRELVGLMGGIYTDVLTSTSTHLVVSSVLSEKYFKANEEKINVMTTDWVEEVWNKSLEDNIKATDDSIMNKYKCPMFYKLTVTASLFNEREKTDIKNIINEGGGKYTSELQCDVTNVLIIPSGRGEKYKFARRWKVICVNHMWLKDSLEKGYSVRYDKYIVPPENQCSTPIQSMRNSKMGTLISNNSEISVIQSACGTTVVGETANFDTQLNSMPAREKSKADDFKTPVKSYPKNNYSKENGVEYNISYRKVLESIKLNDVKKCQHLLDGCKVYLTGFNVAEEEKLRRILKYGGAMRFTELNESVTHVIIGNPNPDELENMKCIPYKPHLVKLEWLSTSIAKGCLEKESSCAYFNQNHEPNNQQVSKGIQQPSPLSKKGLQMLNPVRNIPVSTHPMIDVDHVLIEKYSHSQNCDNQPLAAPPILEPKFVSIAKVQQEPVIQKESDINESNDKLFTGLKFSIMGHNYNVTADIRDTILEYGGSVVSGTSFVVDYTIVPFANITTKIASNEMVTSIWIEECLSDGKIVETKYYHRPVTVPDHLDAVPLNSCVITFSSYNIHERQYLENVAVFLGAKCQDVLSKKQNLEKNIVQTTHLVCSSAQGVKYKAAKKWNLPVIKETWLLECFAYSTMLPVDDFILDENTDVRDRVIPSSSLKQPTTQTTPSVKVDANKQTTTANLTPSIPSTHFPASASSSNSQSNNVNIRNDNLRSQYLFKLTGNPDIVIPSIAEAVNRSDNKCSANEKQNVKDVDDSRNNFPTGLLVEINACASSSLKRKLDSLASSADRAARPNSPKTKIIRFDNHSSSPYEEVGWQDTLTDLSNIHSQNQTNIDEHINNEINVEKSKDKIAQSNKDRDKTKTNATKNNTSPLLPQIETRASNLKHTTVTSRNFLISVSNAEKKSKYENIITSLGGRVLPSFPTDCPEPDKATHIIIDELKKTEKLLCSIASGLWVLHPSYIDSCVENKMFVSEEQYEWGNPKNESLLVNPVKDYAVIAKAAYRWRRTIKDGGPSKKPFVGMRAVIISSASDMQSLQRVVKSGGGSVLPPYDILICTHCLLKSAKPDNIPVQLKELAVRKIHCISAVYLSDFLMYDPPPDLKNFYIDRFKRLCKS